MKRRRTGNLSASPRASCPPSTLFFIPVAPFILPCLPFPPLHPTHPFSPRSSFSSSLTPSSSPSNKLACPSNIVVVHRHISASSIYRSRIHSPTRIHRRQFASPFSFLLPHLSLCLAPFIRCPGSPLSSLDSLFSAFVCHGLVY